MEYLGKQGIGTGLHYMDNTVYRMYSYARGTCKRAEYICHHIVTLPLYVAMTKEDVEYVTKNVLGFLGLK